MYKTTIYEVIKILDTYLKAKKILLFTPSAPRKKEFLRRSKAATNPIPLHVVYMYRCDEDITMRIRALESDLMLLVLHTCLQYSGKRRRVMGPARPRFLRCLSLIGLRHAGALTSLSQRILGGAFVSRLFGELHCLEDVVIIM